MGIKLFGSMRRKSGDLSPTDPSPRAADPGDPVPARFEILSLQQVGPFCVAEIRWPDAANYEGKKILLYCASIATISAAKVLDPHFAEELSPIVPIARFEPTQHGLAIAMALAKTLASVV